MFKIGRVRPVSLTGHICHEPRSKAHGIGRKEIWRTQSVDELLARIENGGTIRYYQTDALGSVIALMDDLGSVKTQYTYSPFGETDTIGETSDNPFQYTGREDDGTGLYYYRARYYSAEMKRSRLAGT